MNNKLFAAAVLAFAAAAAHADAVDTLKDFVATVKTGHASFTQVVTSPDGKKKKSSSGTFDFARPNQFRFEYAKPFEQLIVSDGQKVWIYDADLNQVSSRKFSQALGATPAALLAGGSLEKDFTLSALPSQQGVDWAQALPKAKEGTFQSVRIGFKGKDLSALEIVDNFGQKSLLTFTQLAANATMPPEHFKFTVPKGADLIEQ
ncbi:outer membrane lipoprotein chaperone LolA [Piscinibacter terrae]|nr:outer membrane lipoprotein chaperone LolA [Albitalea terrae]